MIYFLNCAASGLTKIGYTSRDPRLRCIAIANMCSVPLTIVGVLDGDIDTERDLHERYYSVRRHGEWFALANPGEHHDPAHNSFLGPVASNISPGRPSLSAEGGRARKVTTRIPREADAALAARAAERGVSTGAIVREAITELLDLWKTDPSAVEAILGPRR